MQGIAVWNALAERIHLKDFADILLLKETDFANRKLPSFFLKTFEAGFLLKGKEFPPRGSKFFPVRIASNENEVNNSVRVISLRYVSYFVIKDKDFQVTVQRVLE